MASSTLHLPDGQTVTVSPVFGGVSFRSNDLNTHNAAFPPGWNIVLQTEDDEDANGVVKDVDQQDRAGARDSFPSKKQSVRSFKSPTLNNDYLFISSISNPSSAEFKPATSSTRLIALMLWASLYWYFHQPVPDTHLHTSSSAKTADAGKPRGEWRISIRREGVFRGRVLLQKLERMGLIASEDSSVGVTPDERSGEGWQDMFISQRTFWQLDPRIFLFTLEPISHTPLASRSPSPSRPGSPNRHSSSSMAEIEHHLEKSSLTTVHGLWTPSGPGPYTSASHLPTYFPPTPLQYTFTENIRHPIRPKPPRQGEIFYTRFIPSIGHYLSFRVPTLAVKRTTPPEPASPRQSQSVFSSHTNPSGSSTSTTSSSQDGGTDIGRLHDWMNDPRVAYFWGAEGPEATQERFLRNALQLRHSFPVFGCWNGKPFGYVEIYWVREDILGKYLENGGDAWDRGIHCLVGEQEFRGKHRFLVWMSALVHYCFLADYRTQNVFLEPRVDNTKFINYLQDLGFFKEKEISFPHKQAALMRIKREAWVAPHL